MKGIARALTSLPVLALIAWSALALEYTVPGPWWVARSASVLCALVAVGALVGLLGIAERRGHRTQPSTLAE